MNTVLELISGKKFTALLHICFLDPWPEEKGEGGKAAFLSFSFGHIVALLNLLSTLA